MEYDRSDQQPDNGRYNWAQNRKRRKLEKHKYSHGNDDDDELEVDDLQPVYTRLSVRTITDQSDLYLNINEYRTIPNHTEPR